MKKNVNITITAKTDDIHVLVGAVEKGCVELIYGSETVTTANAASAADKYVPLASTYEMKLDSDEGWYIDSVKKVNQETESFGEATYTVSNATMNADASYIGTSARCYKIEFATGDGPALETIYAKEDELVTLQAPGQWVDGKFDYWYCDLDGDGKQETYRAGDIFTMPAKDVTLVAVWNKSYVRIGINMSYHTKGAKYKYWEGGVAVKETDAYQIFPDEPANLQVRALRAYLEGGAWKTENGSWSSHLPLDASKYISNTIFSGDPEPYIANEKIGYEGIRDSTVYGNPKTNGNVIRDNYFKFDWNSPENNDKMYRDLVKAWLTYCKDNQSTYSDTDIPWDAIDLDETGGAQEGVLTVDDFKVVPYAIKRDQDGTWFVEVVILSNDKHQLSYNLNMATDYSGATQIESKWYGKMHNITAAPNPGQITKTVGEVTYTGVFQYWWYDMDSDGNVGEGEKISASSIFAMPDDDVTLTAVWKYYAPVTISQTGVAGTDTAFYQISGDGVNTTVAISGEGSAKVMLPVGVAYTVTPQTDWTWSYSVSEGDDSVISETITVSDTGSNTVSFAYKSRNSGWLHGENHN